jgi:hypothetical protein
MKKENIEVGFSLQSIKTEQFAIIEENFNPKKEIEFGTEIEFKLDVDNKQIGVYLNFEFVNAKKVFLKIKVSCHFIIKEESWKLFLRVSPSKIIIPKGFIQHLAMITTGTTRGVLFAKTEGTLFSKFIIPTLNIVDMFKEDASFEIAND